MEKNYTGSGIKSIPKPLSREGKKEAGTPTPPPPPLGVVDKCPQSGSGKDRKPRLIGMLLVLLLGFCGCFFRVLSRTSCLVVSFIYLRT